LPIVVLVLGLAMSAWIYVRVNRARVAYDRARRDRIVSALEGDIRKRLDLYENNLQGAAGFLGASGELSAEMWHAYVTRLGLLEHSGTKVISIIKPVRQNARAEQFIVIQAEPPAVAARAVGADIAQDALRRTAAEQARDSGMPILTKNTVLFN